MTRDAGPTRRGTLLGAALALPALLAGTRGAAGQGTGQGAGQMAPGMAAMTARANAGTVGVISGGPDGTYVRIAADLAAVLDDGDRLRVLPILGRGSVQNISDIMFVRGVDVGIVQSDALAFVRRQRLFPGADGLIQYVAKLYDEEIHLLAARDVTRVEDLAGKRVNVDVRGSGTAMTASLVFEALGVRPDFTHDPQDAALERLRRGDIAALMYVAGRPARLFSALPAESGLHFLPLPLNPALLETYLPARLGPDAYPNLVPAGGAVDTIAVGAVMAVYAWAPGTERHRKVATFVNDLTAKFDLFLRPPRHPKWREVNLAAQVPGWTRFDPAGTRPAAEPARRRRREAP